MNRPPFASLKFPLVLGTTALVLALAGAGWSHHQAAVAQQTLQTARNAVSEARLNLDRSKQQQQLVAAHLTDYHALAARGFVGPEARLAWIEAVQLANRDAGLYGLDYRMAPRTPDRPELAQGLPLGHTVMTLTLPLLVETDLPRFLNALKTRAPGLMRVRGCRLTRLNDAASPASSQPQLQAECDLLWFTLAPTGDHP